MFGLRMLKDYLDEILSGSKHNDVRSYPTAKRGKIALVDTKSMKVYGFVTLVGVKEITAEEYCRWHQSGKYSNLTFQVEDMSAAYYSYEFKDPIVLPAPIKVEKNGKIWISIPDETFKDISVQETLF